MGFVCGEISVITCDSGSLEVVEEGGVSNTAFLLSLKDYTEYINTFYN